MIEVRVCIGSSCHLKGAYNVIQIFQQAIEEHKLHDQVALKATFCMKQCQNIGVMVELGGEKHSVTLDMAREFFRENILPLAAL
jgi:NADH:ubiquinone oxidoreductase subunit E